MDVTLLVRERLKYLIKKHKVSINALARSSGVAPTTLKNILSGESENPTILSIKKLCDGLGISVQDFFSTSEFDSLEEQEDNE